ncbi:transcriptional regulator [Paraoerskovia sediminicola]|uniref:Transcriptional regulator n=1 Tax=Paraoerskovia sediminicola TaxID=1138587 RepID=A0ABN6XEY1_9CELL|nr:Rv2175c family DNA-binding protein [Paraoerskovia sediminicola]BDZ43340.1 transcriptional regulator [Paraoerskovia sediminicola]
MNIEDLVDDWLTVPDLAEALGTTPGSVRSIVSDRRVVGAKVGERRVFQVPARFVVTRGEDSVAAGQSRPGADDDPRKVVLSSLAGTIGVLTDLRFDDLEILEWLFSPDDALGAKPIDALMSGRKAEVRRVAQTLG